MSLKATFIRAFVYTVLGTYRARGSAHCIWSLFPPPFLLFLVLYTCSGQDLQLSSLWGLMPGLVSSPLCQPNSSYGGSPTYSRQWDVTFFLSRDNSFLLCRFDWRTLEVLIKNSLHIPGLLETIVPGSPLCMSSKAAFGTLYITCQRWCNGISDQVTQFRYCRRHCWCLTSSTCGQKKSMESNITGFLAARWIPRVGLEPWARSFLASGRKEMKRELIRSLKWK